MNSFLGWIKIVSVKKKLILLSILILLFVSFVGVRYFLLDAKNVDGRLKVVSSPTAAVFINSVAVGKTPYEDKQKEGEYILKLIPEGIASDTASWQGKVNIYRNSLTYINRELGSTDIQSAGEIFTVTKSEKTSDGSKGEISIDTDPQGAIVYLDNDEKGIAPTILADVPKGEHEVSVFMPGFFRRTQKINVDPGYRVNAIFKLAVDQSQKPPSPSPSPSEASDSASLKKGEITINDTPTGFLRVREEPTINASESAQVKPGDKFAILDEKDGWYQIEYEKGKQGWISGEYATK